MEHPANACNIIMTEREDRLERFLIDDMQDASNLPRPAMQTTNDLMTLINKHDPESANVAATKFLWCVTKYYWPQSSLIISILLPHLLYTENTLQRLISTQE